MTVAALVYPHQLFDPHPAPTDADCAVLVEDPLFFRQYAFHRQKLMLHRASMRSLAARWKADGLDVRYVESSELPTSRAIADRLAGWKIREVRLVEPDDDYLSRRLTRALDERRIRLRTLEHPHFLTPTALGDAYAPGKSKLFFTEFYIAQRKRLGLLLDGDRPVGGKWSFDPENRKRLPADVRPPEIDRPDENEFVREARRYVRAEFPQAPGDDAPFLYPIDHASAARSLDQFVRQRLERFGDYEDAISTRHAVLYHSLLAPPLNIGLVSPRQALDAALARADRTPLNSLEGFVRQVAGWREFVRLVYRRDGVRQRTTNFWRLTRPMPAACYDGTTGLPPVDHVIRQVLKTGFCHHIERLMILGNFFLLCEIHPDAVYRWFMELFVDAYDWVMVPNVYGMSQYADGGGMTTKPYVSGSSYVLKMSDHRRGPWCAVWDALYWRFVDRQLDFFSRNPRLSMMAGLHAKLGDRIAAHRRTAAEFLTNLHGEPVAP